MSWSLTTRPLRVKRRDAGARPARCQQPATHAGRQRVGDFLDAWVHEFVDVQLLAGRKLHLAGDALEAGAPRLEIGDADGVLVAHPQRQAAGGLIQQLGAAAAQRQEPVQVFAGVGNVLVVGQPDDADSQCRVDGGRKLRVDALGQGGQPRPDRGQAPAPTTGSAATVAAPSASS